MIFMPQPGNFLSRLAGSLSSTLVGGKPAKRLPKVSHSIRFFPHVKKPERPVCHTRKNGSMTASQIDLRKHNHVDLLLLHEKLRQHGSGNYVAEFWQKTQRFGDPPLPGR